MKISVVGTGYVGLVSGACFAEIGNNVICVDSDKEKMNILKNGGIPIHEPGLSEMVERNTKANRLSFTTSLEEGIDKSDVIFIAVGTPPLPNGEADLSFVNNVAGQIAKIMKSYKVIVEKSTVPVGTGLRIKEVIERNNKKAVEFDVVSNPEFLREGAAIYDFLNPDRIIIGVMSKKGEEIMRELYAPINAPIIVTDIKTAEIIKYASNSFLAMKISYINAVANICERAGGDITKVQEAMGYDKRIGREFLNAGCGFGGSCLPKDLSSFIKIGENLGYNFELLKCVKNINEEQKSLIVRKIKDSLWTLKDKTIGILGLSFKPNTDDMRDAPSIDIINMLLNEKAKIKAFDPVAQENAKAIFKDNISYASSPYSASSGCHCLVIITDWDEFKELDLLKIKELLIHPIIIDGRNIYDQDYARKLGFTYYGMGR